MVNFREFVASSGLEVFGGRDSANNDELVFAAEPGDVLLHSVLPGSPFVNVGNSASKNDIREAAVFCAKFSQAWRDSKRDVAVNFFKRCDMKKGRKAKEGTWEVLKSERISVKKSDILKYEEELRKTDETD